MHGDYKVLDVHAHVSAPEAAYVLIAQMLGANTPIPSPLRFGGRLRLPEEDYEAAAARHVAYIDERSIDVQILGPRPYLMLGWMEPHLLPAWCEYVNDLIHKQCALFPRRFLGACQLPQLSDAPDTSNCIPELDRCVNELGFAAAYVSPDPGGRRTTPGMHDPYWFPLYERCQALDVPIIIHGSNSLDPRYRVVPQNYQIAFVTEQYGAVQCLSHGDVFDRYPDLRIVSCHCGGALNRFIPSDHHLAQRDLRNNLFFDTCAYDHTFLTAAIKQRGVDQTCFGVEAPGSGRTINPETGKTGDDLVPFISGLDWLTDEEKRKIFHDNPAKVCPALAKV
jgi:predicted TIM-barrel fold metal-dependent hydrolase